MKINSKKSNYNIYNYINKKKVTKLSNLMLQPVCLTSDNSKSFSSFNILTQRFCSNLPSFGISHKSPDLLNDYDIYMERTKGGAFRPLIQSDSSSYNPVNLQRGQFLNKYGCLFNRHSTDFFRSDLKWSAFGNYIKSKFPNIGDVDIKVYGCSSGDEAYSLTMLLTKLYGGQNFTIEAKDIDSDLIKSNIALQRKGRVFIDTSKLETYSMALGLGETADIKQFLLNDKISTIYYQCLLKPSIIEKVKFSQANILDDLSSINDKKPSIIMCRNMWPYVHHKEYMQYAKSLYDKLSQGSIVVVGGFDYHGEVDVYKSEMFPDALKKAGFKPLNVITGRYLDNNVVSFVFEK